MIYYSKMATQSQVVVSILTGIILSIIGYIQLNIAMLSYQADYERMQATLVRLLSIPFARNVAVKRLNKRRQARPRRFLVRPGFVNQIVVSEEWRQNFRISRVSLYRLTQNTRVKQSPTTSLVLASIIIIAFLAKVELHKYHTSQKMNPYIQYNFSAVFHSL